MVILEEFIEEPFMQHIQDVGEFINQSGRVRKPEYLQYHLAFKYL